MYLTRLPVNVAFGGWGNPTLPGTVDEVVDWWKAFEKDHCKVPDWVYALFERLLDFRDKGEVITCKYRTFHCAAILSVADEGHTAEMSLIAWENAPFVPSNFVAIGDSVMRVNPVFGCVARAP